MSVKWINAVILVNQVGSAKGGEIGGWSDKMIIVLSLGNMPRMN